MNSPYPLALLFVEKGAYSEPAGAAACAAGGRCAPFPHLVSEQAAAGDVRRQPDRLHLVCQILLQFTPADIQTKYDQFLSTDIQTKYEQFPACRYPNQI
jgi:hypothetical protein